MTPISRARLVMYTLAGLATTSGSSTLHAQARVSVADDVVPRALVEALLTQQFEVLDAIGVVGSDGRVVVGRVPSGLAQRIWIPPGATILGGLEAAGADIVVLRSALPRDSLSAAYRRMQPTLGWKVRVEPRVLPRGGFMPAPGSEVRAEPAPTFCSGGDVMSIDIRPVAEVQQITARAMNFGSDACRSEDPAVPPWFERVQYPMLVNPPGTSEYGRGRCAGNWNSSSSTATVLATSMTGDEILEHYGRQLADSGWARGSAPLTVRRVWTRRDSTGAMIELTLAATNKVAAPGCVDVTMDVTSRRDD